MAVARKHLLLLIAVAAVPVGYAAILGVAVLARGGSGPTEAVVSDEAWAGLVAPASYVGAESCRECHEAEFDVWRGSHHDLAMQEADESTVLGDFDDALFEHRGVRTRFFRRDGEFMVETQGADGQQHEYRVGYTFGVTPLQQYLLEMPRGRWQTLTVAWDTRPPSDGGQRWFHLHPDEDTPPGDELHWTAPAYTWNFACAECHSTDLQKNYDAATDAYATIWSEIDVSCEACHGPGSRHVAVERVAAQGGAGVRYPADHGLTVLLGGPGRWRLEDGARTAYLEAAAPGDDQVEACAMCHSRRSQVWPERHPGDALAQTHRLQLLGEGYYFPDGQILDEVFVYGSFRQSKMYDMGVTCADCHEPHSLKLRAEGNNVCATCHTPSFYDSPEHHFHEMGTDGARCVSCHMPTRDYMVVDPRLDHSLRVPRPDRTISMGTPNACNQCHTDQEAQWAQDAIVEWYGDDRRPGHQTYAEAFHAARLGAPGAGEQLVGVAMDEAVPAIARATALEELARHLTPDALPAIEAGLGAADPLMRRAAIEALAPVDPGTRWPLVSPLLDDPVRTVRLAAAGALTDVRPVQLDEAGAAALAGAFEEYLASEMSNADRAEHWVNLAGFHLAQGDVAAMERDFAEARRRNPRFMPAYANQADMYRALGREEDAEHVLMMGLKALPDSPHLHFALALALVRAQRHDEALSELETAYGLGPEDARIGYVYAVALDSAGRRDDAIRVWQEVLGRHPNDVDTLQALASTLYREGRPEEALDHARRLATLVPQDPAAAQLLAAIRQALDG